MIISDVRGATGLPGLFWLRPVCPWPGRHGRGPLFPWPLPLLGCPWLHYPESASWRDSAPSPCVCGSPPICGLGAFLFPCRLAPLARAPPHFLGFTSSLGWLLATGHLRAGVEPEVAVAQGLLNKVGVSCVVDWSFRAQWHPCPQLPTLGSAWCPHWPDFPWTSPSCVGAVPLGCPSPSSLEAFLFHLLPRELGGFGDL